MASRQQNATAAVAHKNGVKREALRIRLKTSDMTNVPMKPAFPAVFCWTMLMKPLAKAQVRQTTVLATFEG